MQADQALPSVTTLVAGAPIRGSWWGHKHGQAIYAVCEKLGDHPDVLSSPLVNGKITFIHRRLWSSLLRVASSGSPWQLDGLSRGARELLDRVDRGGPVRATGKSVAELERRLLVHAHSIHTPSGKHVKVAESWEQWRSNAGFKPRRQALASARAAFEAIASAWEESTGARVRLPWT